MKLEIWLGNGVSYFDYGVIYFDDGRVEELTQKITTYTEKDYLEGHPREHKNFVAIEGDDLYRIFWTTAIGRKILIKSVSSDVEEVIFHNIGYDDVFIDNYWVDFWPKRLEPGDTKAYIGYDLKQLYARG